VFSLPVTGGAITTLASFNGNNGASSDGTLVVSDNTLYGTTAGGAGKGATVFSLSATGGAVDTLATFGQYAEGPVAGVTLFGNKLYGTTAGGGAGGHGIVFSVATITTVATTKAPTVAPPSASGQLLVYDRVNQTWSTSLSLLSPSSDTIVMTAGWNAGPNDWPLTMAREASDAAPTENIVTWDWHEDASLQYAGMLPQAQGTGLALNLRTALPGYTGDFHFIGHSLGSLVDRQAIDDLAQAGVGGQRIDDTILDAPEQTEGLGSIVLGLASSNSNPIPGAGHYAHIDNYITAFGELHAEAENVFLQQGIQPDLIATHTYANTWYSDTVNTPGVSTVGFGTVPAANTYYLQTGDPAQSRLVVIPSTKSQLQGLLAVRDGYELELLTPNLITGAIELAGNAAATAVQKLVTDNGSTYVTTPSITLTGRSSYAWVPVSVPANATEFSFDSVLKGVPAGDSLMVGIGDQVLYMMDGQYAAADGATTNSGGLDLSEYAGQDVEIFFGLFGGENPSSQFPPATPADTGEEVDINNISFVSVPEPSAVFVLLILAGGAALHRRPSRSAAR
jgi:uncharacterized repeat protein (TIGR03803 family)